MKRLAEVSVLAANFGTQGGQFGPNKSGGESDQPTQRPNPKNQEWRIDLPGNYRRMKIPDPIIPPITIIVASNRPRRRASAGLELTEDVDEFGMKGFDEVV